MSPLWVSRYWKLSNQGLWKTVLFIARLQSDICRRYTMLADETGIIPVLTVHYFWPILNRLFSDLFKMGFFKKATWLKLKFNTFHFDREFSKMNWLQQQLFVTSTRCINYPHRIFFIQLLRTRVFEFLVFDLFHKAFGSIIIDLFSDTHTLSLIIMNS